jgi:carbon-monoxide dehydrogenase medium subunit
MKPASFKYIAAKSLDHALALKSEHQDDATFLAGGQSLVPTMNFRLAQPAILIDLNPLDGLSYVKQENGVVWIGAMTRYRSLERDPDLAKLLPLIAEALPHIAHPQIRNRGTIGGNLSHADPASELPTIVTALQGRLRAQSASGERWISASDFFVAPLTNALKPDEMLVEIELPAASKQSGFCFMEVSRRRGDFAMIGAAAQLSLGTDGKCTGARLVLCGAGEKPADVSGRLAPLIGEIPDSARIAKVAAEIQSAIEPGGNVHASPDYQRHLAGVLTQRVLATAAERARV